MVGPICRVIRKGLQEERVVVYFSMRTSAIATICHVFHLFVACKSAVSSSEYMPIATNGNTIKEK
jgi:hypothetical protein